MTSRLARETAIGGYEAAGEAADRIADAYDVIGALIGARREEIALVESATRAWDMVFYAVRSGRATASSPGGPSVSNYLAFLQMKARVGIAIDVFGNGASGPLGLEALESAIGPRTKLIAITHVPTQGGSSIRRPRSAISRRATASSISSMPARSVGQLAVDVRQIGCHMLGAAGRKYLRGPRGTGFLYVRRATMGSLEPPFIDLQGASWLATRARARSARARVGRARPRRGALLKTRVGRGRFVRPVAG